MKLAIFTAMSMNVNVAELKDRLSELLALVEKGKEIIICRRNVPLARMGPIKRSASKPTNGSHRGCMKGTVKILGDLTEPLIPETDWEMLK
jgi:prevent-host-death family protein